MPARALEASDGEDAGQGAATAAAAQGGAAVAGVQGGGAATVQRTAATVQGTAAAVQGTGSGARPADEGAASSSRRDARATASDGSGGSLTNAGIGSRPELPVLEVPDLGGAVSRDSTRLPRLPSEQRRVAVAITETAAIHLTMMGWNRWVGGAPWASVDEASIQRNLHSRWVLDGDDFWVNQLGHPYQGTWSFGAARSAGLGFWASSVFPVVQSALWELTGETTAPAINDQVATSVSGVVFGEVLWRFAEALRADGGAVNEVFAGILSPMSALNAHVLGRTSPRVTPSTRVVLEFGGLAGDAARAAGPGTATPPRAFAGIDFTWGLPGDPDLALDEPFDHFVLQASTSVGTNPIATLRARGLLLGAQLEPNEDVHGLWGLFLSYDFDTTGPYRVSTSAVGVGTSGRAELGGRLALEATGIASAVLLGAAGSIPPKPEGRDYRFGPGEQLLLDMRLRADPRFSGGLTFRQYLLAGDGPGAGGDLVLEATAGVLFRVLGPHAIGAEATRYVRRGHDGAGPLATDGATAIRFYYAIANGG